MKINKIILSIIILITLISGCMRAITVSKVELEKAKSEWHEPKVSIWYYVGSDEEYHYYLHLDLHDNKLYRISKDELEQKDIFPVTKKQNKWRVMPWGVHAQLDQ